MSWLFGIGKKPQETSLPLPPPDGAEPNKQKNLMETYQAFDPSGLERAATAIKEINKSQYAPQALEISKQQEITKQNEVQAKIKEFETAQEQMKKDLIITQQQERRKTLEEESRQHRERAQYNDQLARKREEDRLALQQRMEERNLARQEESTRKQEEMKRATIEYEADLRHKNEMKRLEAELRGHAKVERENHDIRMKKMKAESEEFRTTVLQAVREAGGILGKGAQEFLSDWTKMTRTVGALSLLAFGVYSAKTSLGVAGRFIEARLGKPSLVRDTSRFTILEMLKHPVKMVQTKFRKQGDVLADIILKPDLESRLRDIAIATKNTMRNGGFYRNILLHGPPGTGKTMFAKSLAYHSKMDYAILTGGDFSPLGKDGVTAMHKVFDWSSTSRKGLILFVDEADAFLRKRSSEVISEDLRSTLNAFLFRTGEQSKRFMLILASNQPEQFDWAINDRLDEMVCFDQPGFEERERLVRLYFDKYILQASERSMWTSLLAMLQLRSLPRKLQVANFDFDSKCTEVAQKSEGLSGREISKLVVSWQASTYASESGVLTPEIIDARLEESLKQHVKKVQWEKETLAKAKLVHGSHAIASS